MSIRDEDFGASLTLTEGDDGGWPLPTAEAAPEPRDWRSLYEQAQARAETERARADAAEVRGQELLNDIRRLRASLRKAEAGEDASGPVPRNTRGVHKALASKAPKATTGQLSRENARLRRKVEALHRGLTRAAKSSPPLRAGTQLRTALERARKQKDTIKALRGEVGSLSRETRRLNREACRLRREQERFQDLKATVRQMTAEVRIFRGAQAAFFDQTDLIAEQSSRIFDLRVALGTSVIKNEKLEAELAERPLLSAVFKRLRDRDKTIESLHKKITREREANAAQSKKIIGSLRKEIARQRKANGRLGNKIRALRARSARLEARIAQLSSSRAVLSKAVFGSRSEKQETPRSERKRGQQRGAAGHGRTPRPALEEKEERREPPPDALICSCCGKPYIANGERSSSVIEIAVKAHIRKIVRPRYRRGCDCPSSPPQVIAPPPARLFARTPYGTSVWARVLYERFACFRPLRQVAAWMTDQGLAISPGTMADSVRRFLPLFAPLAKAILAHQNGMTVRHGDETGWRIQALGETGRSRRAWLWISVGKDAVYYHIDASRSAEAAMKLFGSVKGTVFLVCDRYVAYVKMARELDGKVILCWCWIHQRRDFIECAAGQVNLRQWGEGWIERFASVCRLNKERLKHYDPARALERQSPAFDAAHAPLKKAVEDLFAQGEAELAELPDKARQGKALRSLLKHREGLSVFVDNPQVPMDNNFAEREFRRAVIGRRLCFGSDSEDGADLTSTMYSVFGTLALNGIDVLRWLEAWLEACAENGGQPPDDLSPWLPWTMSEERRREFTAPA